MLVWIFLTNENGVFHYVRRPGYVKGAELQILGRLWNKWLLDEYGSRERLAAAWQKMNATPLLRRNEDPARGSVPVVVDPGHRGRSYDYMRFCDKLQREYYQTMTKHLRSIGVKVPISGMNRPNTYHDFRAGAETGDLTGGHYYWSHMTGPNWTAIR